MATTCLITDVLNNSKLTPTIIHYEFGAFVKEEAPSVEARVFSKETGKERVVVLKEANREYKGIFNVEGGEWNQNLLLIRNKKSNKVRVIPTANCTVGHVNKVDHIKGTQGESKDVPVDLAKDGRDLSRLFGSKKQKRQSFVNEKLKGIVRNELELERAVANVSVTNEDFNSALEEGEEDILRLLPPCNRKASTVEEVYPLSDLIPEREMKALTQTAEHLLTNQNEFPKGSHLSTLVSSLKDLNIKVTPEKMVFLLFADALLKYLQVSASDLKSKKALDQICPHSNLLASRILKDFSITSGNSRSRPLYFKDKAVCYIMVLLCLAGNYTVSINTITSCIKKMSNKKLMQLAKIVGLVSPKFGSRTMVLKVPLPSFQVISSKKPRP